MTRLKGWWIRPKRIVQTLTLVLAGLLLGGSAQAEPEKTRVRLTAHVTVENTGHQPQPTFYFRLTVPVEDHPQQTLVKIVHPDQSPAPRQKPHKNGVDSYLEYRWSIPADSTVQYDISYILDVTAFDADTVWARSPDPAPARRFQEPSRYSQSDAPEVRALAMDVAAGIASPTARARAAFDHVAQSLDARDERRNHGALYALQTGGGDCTEFNALFIALSRALDIPARMTSEFLFGQEDRRFSMPNHHGAEVYLNGRWIPADANLVIDPSFGYGFGYGGIRKVVLNREGAWVWGTWSPKTDGVDLDVDMAWSLSFERTD